LMPRKIRFAKKTFGDYFVSGIQFAGAFGAVLSEIIMGEDPKGLGFTLSFYLGPQLRFINPKE
jgi:hypothetical protein